MNPAAVSAVPGSYGFTSAIVNGSPLRITSLEPFDTLKIDRSFVNDVENDSGDAAIAKAIITLGHQLDLEVIAEGVENQGQLNFLRSHGCDSFQGFLCSPPLPADEMIHFIAGKNNMGAGDPSTKYW